MRNKWCIQKKRKKWCVFSCHFQWASEQNSADFFVKLWNSLSSWSLTEAPWAIIVFFLFELLTFDRSKIPVWFFWNPFRINLKIRMPPLHIALTTIRDCQFYRDLRNIYWPFVLSPPKLIITFDERHISIMTLTRHNRMKWVLLHSTLDTHFDWYSMCRITQQASSRGFFFLSRHFHIEVLWLNMENFKDNLWKTL